MHPVLLANTQGRDFILADLHGHRNLLEKALVGCQFDPDADRLISVGDLIDRGPDSLACLELLNEPWFYLVRGNHEQMMIDAVLKGAPTAWSLWVRNGGSWALECSEEVLQGWASRLDALPLTLTVHHQKGLYGICHAQYSLPDWQDRLTASQQHQTDWLWGRDRVKQSTPNGVVGVDCLFHGHTIVDGVTRKANSLYLDCGAYAGGPLVLLAVDDCLPFNP